VTGERFLKFYPGLCIGPAFSGFAYNSRVGAHAVPIKYKEVIDFDAYSEGGGFFKLYSQVANGQSILSTDQPRTEILTSDHSESLPPRTHDHDSEPVRHSTHDHQTFHENLTSRSPAVQTLGTYTSLEKDTPAIVKCRVGNGLAVLSGVHVEFSAHLLEKRDVHLKPLLPKFVRSEGSRVQVFRDMVTQLGVKCLDHSKL